MESRGAIFREIHKNTWLRRLTLDHKKIGVGLKKPDRCWVVFCVHDDCEALLEGYLEPRQAASHVPEWTISLQNTLHISHSLVPSEQEYEFVITLATDVVRFYASSWEIMQEWVDTLRLKLREMKILSPRENVYSKLPEIRPPLLPTRDPTSPLPAPPPVPADIVPGIEHVIQPVVPLQTTNAVQYVSSTTTNDTETTTSTIATTSQTPTIIATVTSSSTFSSLTTISTVNSIQTNTTPITAMSNTLTQNLLNMLSNPVSTICNQINTLNNILTTSSSTSSLNNDDIFFDDNLNDNNNICSNIEQNIQSFTNNDNNDNNNDNNNNSNNNNNNNTNNINNNNNNNMNNNNNNNMNNNNNNNMNNNINNNNNMLSLAKTFSNNVLSDPNTCPSTSAASLAMSMKSNSCSSQDEFEEIESCTFNDEPILIPRPQTSRSASKDNINKKSIQSIQQASSTTISSSSSTSSSSTSTTTTPENEESPGSTNITIIQLSSPLPLPRKMSKDIFNFPIVNSTTDDNFKSNVQIIPSDFTPKNLNNMNHYGSINKNTNKNNQLNELSKITTVQVTGANNTTVSTNNNINDYGRINKIVNSNNNNTSASHSIEIDLTNVVVTCISSSSITNIPIGENNNEINIITTPKLHYEQVFVTPTVTPIPSIIESTSECSQFSPTFMFGNNNINNNNTKKSTSHTELYINRIDLNNDNNTIYNNSTSERIVEANPSDNSNSSINTINNNNINNSDSSNEPEEPVILRNKTKQINIKTTRNNLQLSTSSPLPAIRQLLQRGLTEVAINRPNKKDTNLSNRGRSKIKNTSNTEMQTNTPRNENTEQRRRSSSTSDAHASRNRTNNTTTNELRNNNNNNNRLQPAPQPLRLENQLHGGGGGSAAGASNNVGNSRITLREQQVLQLRREMMHPGGVRIQLRRKDCIGSMALVDAFGGVWIAGWKQKEHPILYNALHIGDQLISIGGITVSGSTDANKIFRNKTGLYLDIIIRRIPFGRVYVIRRELEGQCLGLIRDGNTSTIIDVVPNSLSARHGLPPKAQSCDGLSLTFWVLTEINGRPLNLFFKESEVKDRLNAVGRDISILVQPLDLITKFKKQLKSLRGHKEYIVQ